MTRAAAAVATALVAVGVLAGCGPAERAAAASTAGSGLDELSGIERDLDAIAQDIDAPGG